MSRHPCADCGTTPAPAWTRWNYYCVTCYLNLPHQGTA